MENEEEKLPFLRRLEEELAAVDQTAVVGEEEPVGKNDVVLGPLPPEAVCFLGLKEKMSNEMKRSDEFEKIFPNEISSLQEMFRIGHRLSAFFRNTLGRAHFFSSMTNESMLNYFFAARGLPIQLRSGLQVVLAGCAHLDTRLIDCIKQSVEDTPLLTKIRLAAMEIDLSSVPVLAPIGSNDLVLCPATDEVKRLHLLWVSWRSEVDFTKNQNENDRFEHNADVVSDLINQVITGQLSEKVAQLSHLNFGLRGNWQVVNLG